MGDLTTTPELAFTFLRGVGTSRAIRRYISRAGYTDADHREGWDLLHACSGFASRPPPTLESARVRDAVRALDAWNDDGLRIVSASLARHYPAQGVFVLEGIGQGVGPSSVTCVATLLARVAMLEKGRPGTREADRAAFALLERRGFTLSDRARLKKLVADARSGRVVFDDEDEGRDEELAALMRLHAWLAEWRQIARALVRRREYLVRLGLVAARRTSASDADELDGEC